MAGAQPGGGLSLRRRLGLFAGPAGLLLFLAVPAPAGLEPGAWHIAGVGALMAVWWLTEAVPIPATSLLPLLLFPLLGGGSIGEAAAPYANPVIFLFLGGFLIALAMQRWKLHRRVALHILRWAGSRPAGLVAGFMVASAFLSLWVSNTATTMMMAPIGLSVIGLLERDGGAPRRLEEEEPGAAVAARERRNFGTALMLGIAYAASLGGIGTLIGTPPNAFLAGFLLETHGVDVGFARWMLIGLPVVLAGLPLAYVVLTRVAFPVGRRQLPGGRELIEAELEELGAWHRGERAVAVVFCVTALLWICRPLLQGWLPGLSDAGIAVAGGLSLFLLPVDWSRGEFVLNWEWAEKLPWDLLLLFGGGLSLAAAVERTELNRWLGGAVAGLGEPSPVLFILTVVTAIVLITELTSNTATAAAFLPVVAAVAIRVGWDPLLLTVPAALAASCAFMLPVATAPNAIVYGTHHVSIPQMARAGLLLNLVMIPVVTAVSYFLVPIVLAGLS
ncbi:MAG: SLC13 family permease [Gemmatimonadota bacterium]